MTRVLASTTVGIALCLALAGCYSSGNHPGTSASPAQIVGTWTAPAKELSEPTIVLRVDGSFIATSIPKGLTCGDPKEIDYGQPENSQGTWKLEDDLINVGMQQVNLHWSPANTQCFGSLYTEKLDGELHIFMWIGDPDADETVTFSRKN